MIETQNHTNPSQSKKRQSLYLGIDVPLLLASFTLIIFGLLMVYSASWDFALYIYDDPTYIFSRQLLWLVLAAAAAILATFFDYHYWRRLAVPALTVVLGALLIVLVINEVRHGATRTLNAGSYMPSEAAKIVAIIYLSVWLYSKRNYLGNVWLGMVPLAVIIGVLSGLILAQPDLSAAATIIFMGGVLFFLAGGDLKQIAVLLLVTVTVGWFVVQIHPTGNVRVASYLDGLIDPTQASYHVRRSIEAFLKGGVFGVGIGKANTKLTGLPVPPTDSIFAVVGEETGLVGTTSVVVLYGILIWRGLKIARNAPDQLGSLMAAGLSIWLTLEAFINMAVMVNLVPFAGNALPFISAGGSNLVVSMMAIGILMNIARLSKPQPQTERITDAPIGVRRSQRRRRVPRAGSVASLSRPSRRARSRGGN